MGGSERETKRAGVRARAGERESARARGRERKRARERRARVRESARAREPVTCRAPPLRTHRGVLIEPWRPYRFAERHHEHKRERGGVGRPHQCERAERLHHRAGCARTASAGGGRRVSAGQPYYARGSASAQPVAAHTRAGHGKGRGGGTRGAS
eukprot:187925-Prymnesium_polylepis.3